MKPIVRALLAFAVSLVRSHVSLQLEILALRHQLTVYHRSIRRPQVRPSNRILWSWLARRWARWREVLVFVQPATVLAWQRTRFREYWARLSRTGPAGRPAIRREGRQLIREISVANPRWGSPRILGELRKLGIAVAKSTVEKYRVRPRRPTSPTWRAFLKHHVTELVSIDFFTVPTVGFKVLFVLVVLAHARRRIVHFNVTEHPTARWTAQQLVEAFPWETAPKYLLRDRDAVYGEGFQRRVANLGIDQILAAPRSPWQNAYAERLIGSIRRECLDHAIVFSEGHLRRLLASYFHYHHRWRTPLSLAMDCPEARPVQPPDQGAVVAFPEVGGLHHHYERLAA
ncbi:MAG: integrase core domain-containing protein [Candidatus Methylomirabilales bacterium]